MPTVEIITNVQGADTKALSVKASEVVAKLLSKPQGYVLAFVTVNPSLTFAGNELPAALVNIGSIGSVGGPRNQPIVAGITGFIASELDVSPQRIYVSIRDIPATDFGHNGSTFA
ncbi:hypothetical protein GGI12_002315 [Dipsacomyces acuminosporus]|nr:hypothetical protein GGI12_002315 [Dipsacomyces acuminosporus]